MNGKREDYAWAAGIFDGEGCFSTATIRAKGKRYTYPQVRLQVGQSSKDGVPQMLLRLVSMFGGKIWGPYAKPGNRMPTYTWMLLGHTRVQAVTAGVWEWLGDVKRSQVATSLRSYLEYQREPNVARA